MSEEKRPSMESLEARCLLSAHAPHMAVPVSHPVVVQAVVAPMMPGVGVGYGRAHHVPTTIVTVDAVAGTATVSVTNRKGAVTQTTYNVSPTATLTIDGAAATLDQFITGLNVKLKTDPADPTTIISMAAVGAYAQGKVTAIDAAAGTITLVGKKGGAGVTYTLGKGAAVTVNGLAGALAGIAVGSMAKVTLSALDATVAVAVRAVGECGPATADSVDTGAGTLTVSRTSRDGTVTQTTYNVSPGVAITIDGQPGTLDQLVAGVTVSLQTDPKDAATVVSITAEGAEVHGMVSAVDTTGGTITLTDRTGTATTYSVGAATVEVNGVVAALADVTVGSLAEVTFSALDGTIVISVEARTMPSFGTHGQGHGAGRDAGIGGGMMGAGPGTGMDGPGMMGGGMAGGMAGGYRR